MWVFEQTTGRLFEYGGHAVATGYSGFGAGKNNPAMERIVNVGPVPRGKYDISDRFDSETHGPVCMHLSPLPGTETFGRGGFLIHGDSASHPGLASHGCIILPRPVRLRIAESEDREMEVV